MVARSCTYPDGYMMKCEIDNLAKSIIAGDDSGDEKYE